jgi:hypothetical protein
LLQSRVLVMKEELSVAHSIISFDNLADLLSELDTSIETHSKLTKRYEDRLGILLRQANGSGDGRVRAASSEMGSASGQIDSDQQQKKKKDDKRRDTEEKGWIVMEAGDNTLRIASGTEGQLVSNEISLLFKVIETLKARMAALESSRKTLSDLASQGFKSDRRLKVVFKDGLPKYVIPSADASSQQHKRFKYAEQFRLAVLK